MVRARSGQTVASTSGSGATVISAETTARRWTLEYRTALHLLNSKFDYSDQRDKNKHVGSIFRRIFAADLVRTHKDNMDSAMSDANLADDYRSRNFKGRTKMYERDICVSNPSARQVALEVTIMGHLRIAIQQLALSQKVTERPTQANTSPALGVGSNSSTPDDEEQNADGDKEEDLEDDDNRGERDVVGEEDDAEFDQNSEDEVDSEYSIPSGDEDPWSDDEAPPYQPSSGTRKPAYQPHSEPESPLRMINGVPTSECPGSSSSSRNLLTAEDVGLIGSEPDGSEEDEEPAELYAYHGEDDQSAYAGRSRIAHRNVRSAESSIPDMQEEYDSEADAPASP